MRKRRIADRESPAARRRRKAASGGQVGGLQRLEHLEERRLMAVTPLEDLVGLGTVPFAADGRAVVVIDASVEGGERLAGSFSDAAATVVIGPGDDLFGSVGDVLGRLGGVSAIHLVSHGSPGRFSLGDVAFDAAGADEWDDGLVAWNRLAGPSADLYLWGCDIAGGDGASLVDSIHALSGFDVAASIDVTGPARLGGDFDLEYAAGDVGDPGLIAGVDVLWDTTLAPPADHTFSTSASKDAMKSAFTALTDTVAPAIKTALEGQTSSTATDNLVQRTITDLFGDPTSISPADLLSLLDLKDAASTYLDGASPTLSGLASAIEAVLATKATAAGAAVGSRTITVAPSVVGNLLSLEVAITATGTKQVDVDLGTDALPTIWGSVVRTLNSDYGAVFRTTPKLRTGTTLTTGFTIGLDLTDNNAPVATLGIAGTTLAGGTFSFGPDVRFGILDATLGGQASLPYSTTVSFGTDGPTRAVDGWATPGATATPLGTPSATVDLPITALINGTAVTETTSKLRIVSANPSGLTPPIITAIDLGLLAWFGNLTSDELINAVKRVGAAYETLGANEALDSAIPFVQRTSLVDVFKLGDLFDEKIGSVIDVSVPTVMPTEAGSGLAFTATAGGTQLTLSGDKRSDVAVGQAIGLIPSTPSPLDAVIRTVTAVTLSGGNTLVTINATIDATTTAGSVVGTTRVRPDDLQTLADFQSYPAFASLGISPVYDKTNGTVSIQFAPSVTTPAAGTPAVAFDTPRLGAVTFSSGGVAGTTATKLAFGVQFDIGPGSPIVIGLGGQPVSSGRIAADATVTFTSGSDTWNVTVKATDTSTNSSFADLVADFNAARATAQKVVGGVPETTSKREPKLSDITASFEFFSDKAGLVSVRTTGGSPTTLLSNQAVPTLTRGRLTGTQNVVFNVTPVGGTATPVTVDPADTSTNESIDDLVDDIDDALTAAGVTVLKARKNGDGTAIEFYTPTVNASMPIGITIEATRSQTALDLGFADGIELSDDTKELPISLFGRPTGVKSRVVPHSDATKKFAESVLDWQLDGLAGTVGYGINTVAFATTDGDVDAAYSAVLAPAGGSIDDIDAGTPGLVTEAFGGSAALKLRTLSRVGVTNDIAPTAEITIAVADLTKERIDAFVNVGGVLAVPGLEDSGRGTGRLSADAKVRFTAGSDTYEVTVTQATAADNTTFAHLVSEFNQALTVARRVVNGTTDTSTSVSLAGQFSFAGSGGRVSVMHLNGGVWYPVLENLLVPNLAAGGGTSGRLATASSLSVIRGAETYTVTVPASDTTNNTTFAELVADFNAAFATARRRLPALAVPNLATGGATSGVLSADASVEIVRGVDTFVVTVLAANTTGNATFADLVDDFNDALQTAQKQTEDGPVPVDARSLLVFSAGQTGGQIEPSSIEDARGLLRFAESGTAGRVQPQSQQEVVNPAYATVTPPPNTEMGEIGYQAGLSVKAIAGALSSAARVFDLLERDLKEFTDQSIPLVGQTLSDLIELDGGLDGRIQAFGKLSASSPQELQGALRTSLGVPSTDLRVIYDSIRKAYRIDFAYRASKLATASFDVDMGVYYELLGKPLPKGIDSLTDGDSKTPLNVVVNSTSVLSIGYDLVSEKTFLYGHDGSTAHGIENGTSFTITFSVNGQNLQFPAKFGMDVRNGTARLDNGELVVELAGPQVEKQFTASTTTLTVDSTTGLAVGMAVKGTGIPAGTVIAQITGGTGLTLSKAVTKATGFATFTTPSARYEINPATGSAQLAALDIDNYAAAFGGKVRAKMPIFDAFAPANLTVQSQADMLSSVDDPTLLQDHPASFYFSMPDLAGYFDAVNRLEEAREAISTLTAAGKTVDAGGIQLGNELDRLGLFGSEEYLRWRASWRGRLETAAEDLGGVLFAFAPELENSRNLLGAQETLIDYIRDPAMVLDKLNAAISGVEGALKGLNKIPLPFMEGKLGGAVSSVFSFRTGWLLDMRNKMRGAGEGIFDVMRQSVFEYLGPKNANILLKYDPVSMDRSLDSMVAATRPEDIGVVFLDKNREVLQNDVRGADAFEIVFRLGQKVFDTGIDLGFQLDALQSIGIGAAFNGGLRLQVGWEMLLGFGFSITDGFYLKVDSTGDANSRGNFSGSTGQFEAQLRFDATLTGASKNYTQQWDEAGYWKIVDTKGTAITTDDTDVIDATTNEPYRAIAVNNQASDVTATVSTVAAEYDPCGCGEKPSTTTSGQKIWWVVGTDSGNGSFVPAELNDQGMYVPQTSAYPHTLIEVTAMKPAQLSGSLFFLRLAATDKIRRGLSGFTDVDSQYFYDAGDGPQVTATQRDDEATGVNRNNELPTRFSAAVGLNMVDPSASAGRNSVRDSGNTTGGAGTKRVADPSGKLVVGNSGAIAKEGTAWSLAPLFWQQSEIEGVYAKEYYAYKLQVAPPAKYDALDFPVRLATGGNIALRGMGIIDGVQVKVGDRVLVKSQSVPSENGIYTVSPGGWDRAFDANDNADFNGGSGKPMFVFVEEGRTNKGTGWNLRDDTGNVTLGDTSLYFERTMVAVRELLPAGLGYLSRLVPYQPFIVLPIRADLIDEQQSGSKINIQVEYDLKNYLVTVDTSSGGTGAALRTAQLNRALAEAVPAELDVQGDVVAVANAEPKNLLQAGFRFVTPGEADKKWYRIEFARLKEVNGLVSRQATRSGTFVDYGTPLLRDLITTQKGWDPVADINADASPGRITWRELKSAGFKKTFQVDFQADAVANLTMELSVGDTASNPNISIPRIFADFNLDWSTRAARARIDKAKQAAVDLQTNPGVLTSGSGSGDEPDVSLVKRVKEEEGIEKPSTQTPGGDKGIDPASPLVKEMDLKPEIGFNNIRLDVGSFLTKFIKPAVDEAEPYLRQIRPALQFFNSRIPVLSDVAGRTIKVVDLLEAYGGPKGKTVRAVIDVVTAVDNLVARIAALPPGVNVQIPMGRFWFPKESDDPAAVKGAPLAPGAKYKYGDLVYDNLALGKRASGFYGGSNSEANVDAKAAIDALRATNPDGDAQKKKQGFISNNAADRGGIRVPLLDDPLNLFQLMMGKTATLVTYQLPKLRYEFEKEIPLVKIVCFEVGLRASFELNSNLAFGFDTYGINQYMVSGDIKDIAQGFYVSDRANADGTGADVPEFQAIASFGLYGGVNLELVKAGIEGGLRFVGEVNLNDPNNDGKLRLTELIGIVADTGNPLDVLDLSFRGEVYARYYYKVGLGKLAIKGGKTFARIPLFNLVREGNDGAPIFASRLDGTEGDAVPGTLLIHVGEAAVKRVSNQDPLKAKDGSERYEIWNSGDTVYVRYLNYDESTTKEWEGVTQVVFEGGLGNDVLDASGLNGIPLLFKGGDGDDRVELGSGHASTVSRIEGDDGIDTIIVNGGGIVELVGGVGNDVITGGTGIVRIEAGEGNDTITTRAGSSSTIVMADDYGIDTAVLAAEALKNLLDFTTLGSALEILLDGALAANADGTATAGEKNKLTFNVGGVTEIRGSSQDDTFTAKNPRTRNASRFQLGWILKSQASERLMADLDVPNVAADGATSGRLAWDSSIAIDIGKYTYTVTVPKTTADNNLLAQNLVDQFNAALATASRQDRTSPDTPPSVVDARNLIQFVFPTVDFLTGLLLRGGQGDDLYDLTLDNVGGMGTDGIAIDDVQGVMPAAAGEVKTCGTCKKIESIAVSTSGKGYELPPEVMIIDPTGSGAKATAVIDGEGRVTGIQIIEGGSGYTSPTALLIAPRSLGDRLVISSTRPAATLFDRTAIRERTSYGYVLDGKSVRFLGWGDGQRPVGLDQSEIDSVTVNMPEGVLSLDSRINLFQTFTVNASRMVQNGRVNADTIDIETDHGFQVRYPLNAVNSGDVRIRVTGDGTNTGEGSDLNKVENRATATAVVSAGGVTSLTLGTAGSKYFFTPSITVGADGATPGTGARFAATIAGSGGGLSGFARLSSGTGYYSSPAPMVVIPPPASIQVDAMITSSRSSVAGIGDGRGRVLLFADTGMVSTSGEVFFPEDKRSGQPQGSRTIDWIGGDFRYRSTVGLDDIVSPVAYPGVSVGTGAAFTAVLDADGRVTGFTRVTGGSGYSSNLPPLIEIEGLATAVVDSYGTNGSIESLRVTYPGDGYGQPPRVTIKPNGFGRIVNSPDGIGSGLSADGVTPMNRVHIRSIGGKLVAKAGAGVGDPLKPIKSDVETFVAEVTTAGSGGVAGRLAADSKIRFTAGGDQYEVTVTRASAATNTSLSDLVSDFNQALASARKIVNGEPDTSQTYNLTSQFFFGGPVGGVTLSRREAGRWVPLLSNIVISNLASGASTSGGVHLLEKDGLRIGKDQEMSGISTVNGDVSITTFGGALELGAPRQAVDEQGRLLWQDASKTIPIYDRDPVTGRIIYEGGDIRVGSGDVKFTADDVEVNVDLNASGGTGTITLQPVGVKAEIGLAGTRARIEGTVTDGKLTGFDAAKFWGGRGYTTPPLVIVDPAGQRAFASAVVEAGKVTAVEVLYGGTNYDPDNPPVVTLEGGGVSGGTPANQARARAIVGADGVITSFELLGGTVEEGRLKADATIRFTHGSDTYEVTVTKASAAGNDEFADLVANLQASLVTARKVINGAPDLTRSFNILSQFQFEAGTSGQIGLRTAGVAPAVQILQNYVVPNLASAGGSGYGSSPNVIIASPGQALVQAVLDTSKPDPVTGRFSVKEFIVTNPGRNYRSVPTIEVAAPYDFTLDADEVNKFAGKFAQVVIGRIEGQHLFHSPEGTFQGNVVLRAPRAGGTLDVASFTTTGPVSIVGSGSTFHFDATAATVSGTSISIDDNVIVHRGVSGVATSSTGEIIVFGAGKGMIDGDPSGDDDGDNEDLRLAANTTVAVTGAIGSRYRLDDLTITSATRGAVTLEQGVRLTGSLRIKGSNTNGDTNPGLDADDVVGAVMIGGIVDVAGDLVIDASSAVTFQAEVTVGGKLEIRGAASVTFKRALSVGGSITLEDVPGAIRFGDVVHVVGEAEITAGTLIEIGGGIRADGNLTLTSDAIDLKGGVATVVGSGDSTLVLRPKTANRPIRVGTPQGLPNDTLDISDADLAAIDDGWKRVVIGDEAVGTGEVTIGSIGSQQGGRNSSLASTTTIVGGSVTVAQKVDVAATAAYLQLVARTGDVTVNAAINETASERNAWLRLEAVQGDVTIKAPIRATQTVSLISGKTTSQTSAASIITSGLRVSSGGAVTLESQGNAFDTLAVVTTDDAISIRENSGYTIGTVDGVSGVTVGTATATLTSSDSVTQTQPVTAKTLDLRGTEGRWTLDGANAIGTLSANTGSLSVADVAELTVGSITASKASGTAVELRAPSGIRLESAITTAGGDVVVHDKATLEADITIDVEDGSATGEVEFRSTVDATSAGQQSLTVTGKLDAQDAIGATTALKSLSVSDAATLAGGKTFRTTGDQTYSGAASSTGTITVQAGNGKAVKFLGNVSLGGLTTAAANYDVELTGTSVAVTSAVTFNNTGSVTLGNDATDDLLFAGGVTSSAPSTTSVAGTIRTTNANATFGNASPARSVVLTRDATVSTGSGSATFAGTVNGARRLVVDAAGDTTFSSVVGGDTPLAHLETDAAGRTLLNGGAITTASPTSQVYNDDVVLGETTTLTANGGGAVTFAKTITGGRSLTVKTSGTTTFNGAVSILSLATDANGTTRLGANVTTSAAAGQVYDDAVILTAEATLAAGSGAITFAKTVDGGFPLAVNTTGTSTFGGKVGDGTPLASLTTDSGITTGGTSIVTGGLIRTSGQQAWRDNVVSLATDATFRSENGAITAGAITPGAATTFSSSGKSASFSAATGIGTDANPIRLAQTDVTATITGTGDIYLVGVGDLVITSAGLLTPSGQISLGASGDIRVPSGGRIAAGSVPGQGVSATKPIRWSVVGTADSGPGSLRQVIANANTTGVAGVVVFSGSTNVFTVGSRLPVIASPLTIDGTNRGVVINANRQVDAGLILQAAATGSVVRGITLQNFTGFGITLDGVRNATIERNTVTSINTVGSMGLLAQGDLAGTKVLGNTFSGGLRGALLDGARNLVFGEIGNGNVLSNNRAAPSDPSFAGTGIRAQGMLTGTVVAGNTFTNNNYGFAFINALNLRLERNVFTRNSVAGIYIEGDSRGSSQTGNTFGKSQSDRNKVNLLRSQGTRFGGAAVTPVGQPQASVTKNRK